MMTTKSTRRPTKASSISPSHKEFLGQKTTGKLLFDYDINKKPVKLDLNIEIKDFGPVTQGKIKLKPLTIFVGPNSSGKSYTALLMRSLLNAESQFITDFIYVYDFNNTYDLLKKEFDKLGTKKSIIISHVAMNKFIERSLNDIIKKQFKENLIKTFSSDLNDLKRIGTKSFSLKITSNIITANIKFSNNEFKITNIKCPHFKFKINVDCSDMSLGYNITSRGTMITIDIYKPASRLRMLQLAYEAIHYSVLEYFQNHIPNTTYYLQAARSGILHSRKMIIAGMIQNMPSKGLENLESPHISSVIRDFLHDILLMSSSKGEFSDLAKELEEKMFDGTINLDSNTLNPIPEITFTHKKHVMPLNLTSSAISELATFILYIKHLVTARNVLIIEEPEAHLHPRNQILFAKFLVKLIRKNLNIILTTHSPFILEHLNNFLKIQKLPSKTRIKNFGLREDDYLKPDEISIHRFKQFSISDNNIKLVKISKEDGISQKEFVEVSKEMYDKSLAVHYHLNGDQIEIK